MRSWFALLAAVTIAACTGDRPVTTGSLNLDFESFDSDGTPSHWNFWGEGYLFRQDSLVKFAGRYGLRGQNFNTATKGLGGGGTMIPAAVAHGKSVRVCGYIKTDSVANGYAGLWCRIDGEDGMLALDNMEARKVRADAPYDTTRHAGIKGTREWTRCEITLPVDSMASEIVFGVLFTGTGTAWFDHLSIDVDGVPYGAIPAAAAPTSEEIAWLRSTAAPLKTADAGSGFDDLKPFGEFVGDAAIVGLGEATHGTHEFFAMKHRLLEYLVIEKGFTVFSIEASSPEAFALNDYVLHGVGDPKQLVAGMGFWTWNTGEVVDMVKWMREYNASGKGVVEFTGFDMQNPVAALQELTRALDRIDRQWARSVLSDPSEIRAGLQFSPPYGPRDAEDSARMRRSVILSQNLADSVHVHRDALAARSSAGDADWAVHCADLLVQGAQLLAGMELVDYQTGNRDSAMAANVAWLHAHRPAGTKIVLWAHNFHIGRSGRTMGEYLASRFGASYRPMGFLFHTGKYNASGTGGLKAYDAHPSEAGSFEYYFHTAGYPICLLDFRNALASNKAAAWATQPLNGREIGAMAMDQFGPSPLAHRFDGMIFFDHTTPSMVYR